MASIVKRFLILFVIIPLAACKIRIVVPDGTTVVSDSQAFRCDAGQVCEIDVVDVFFDETFDVETDEGLEFIEWRWQDRGLCGGRGEPCRLTTTGFVGNETLIGILESDQSFFLEPVVWPVVEGAYRLEYREIDDEPIVRDANGVAIGSWQGGPEDNLSMHFEGLPDTYTISLADDLYGSEPDPFNLFYRNQEDCQADRNPLGRADERGVRPNRAYHQINRRRVYIPAPDSVAITERPGSVFSVGGAADTLAFEGSFFPLVASNYFVAFPLTIKGLGTYGELYYYFLGGDPVPALSPVPPGSSCSAELRALSL